jgi:hypothetical protein
MTDPFKRKFSNLFFFSVQEIVLWRDPKKSAIALVLSLLALILVAKFTFISLVAWSSLIVLGGTLGFRVFKLVESQIKKTDAQNPFNPYLHSNLDLPQEKIHAQVSKLTRTNPYSSFQADVLVQHSQCLVNQLKRLFLVENLFDSIKFGVLLWTLTYIGAWFSGITLVTLCKSYQTNNIISSFQLFYRCSLYRRCTSCTRNRSTSISISQRRTSTRSIKCEFSFPIQVLSPLLSESKTSSLHS